MTSKVKHPYYNFDRLLSHTVTIDTGEEVVTAGSLFNIVAGGRGIGKTYGALKLAISHYLKRGEEFIYLRRYRPEVIATKQGFFSAVEQEFPSWDFRVNGDLIECAGVETRDDKKRTWFTMGYFATLSTAQARKGVSYARVTKIIFDEFIIERSAGNRYLKSEVDALTNFVSTVDRYQNRVRVIMLANAVSIMNPYFAEWDIRPEQAKDGWSKHRGGLIVAHFPDSKDFAQSIYKTVLGQFIKGTDYARYAVDNEFADNTESLVEKKDPAAVYVFSVETDRGTFSVWSNLREGIFYAQWKRPRVENILTLVPEKMGEGKELVTYNDRRLQIMRGSFNRGDMFFDTPRTRNAFLEASKR